jgi:hypothetical protein
MGVIIDIGSSGYDMSQEDLKVVSDALCVIRLSTNGLLRDIKSIETLTAEVGKLVPRKVHEILATWDLTLHDVVECCTTQTPDSTYTKKPLLPESSKASPDEFETHRDLATSYGVHLPETSEFLFNRLKDSEFTWCLEGAAASSAAVSYVSDNFGRKPIDFMMNQIPFFTYGLTKFPFKYIFRTTSSQRLVNFSSENAFGFYSWVYSNQNPLNLDISLTSYCQNDVIEANFVNK